MPDVISEDHRKTLIDIFFAVIITVGLVGFIGEFAKEPLRSLDFSDILKLHHGSIPLLFNTLFFSAAFFWVISHWVFYHVLIREHPYNRWRKFFVDIVLFSLMAVIILTSFLIYDQNPYLTNSPNLTNSKFSLFIISIAIWHGLACLWHLSDISVRSIRKDLKNHFVRFIVYLAFFLFFLIMTTFLGFSNKEWFRHAIMIVIILLMISFNAERLYNFIGRKNNISQCCLLYYDDHAFVGFPEDYLPQICAKKLIEMCKNKNLQERLNHYPSSKQLSAHIVEFLIIFWLNQTTSLHDSSFGFENTKIPITRQAESGNLFLDMLPLIEPQNLFVDTSLPKDIKLSFGAVGNSQDPNTGMVVLRRHDIKMKITYKKSKYFPYSNRLAWPKIGAKIGEGFLENYGIVGLMKSDTYEMELDARIRIQVRKRMSSYIFGKCKETEWVNIMLDSFNEFFDIKH